MIHNDDDNNDYDGDDDDDDDDNILSYYPILLSNMAWSRSCINKSIRKAAICSPSSNEEYTNKLMNFIINFFTAENIGPSSASEPKLFSHRGTLKAGVSIWL